MRCVSHPLSSRSGKSRLNFLACASMALTTMVIGSQAFAEDSVPVVQLHRAAVAVVGPAVAVIPSLPTPEVLPQLFIRDADTIVLVLGGDIGLGGSDEPVHAEGSFRHGKRTPWADMSARLKPLITGDINFANLETVVTDRNDLSPVDKAFNFRSHPRGVTHLTDLGFNVFSTANNHAVDYGEAGLRETLRHLATVPGLKAYPGIGFGYYDAAKPHAFTVKAQRFAFSAIGIGGSGVRPNGPRLGQAGNRTEPAAMLSYSHGAGDFKETIDQLMAEPDAFRVLSVHYGPELAVRPSRGDVQRLRDEAVRARGVDLVVGHHAHVAAGAAIVDGKLILFGLGNLMHPGMQDMGRMNMCRDYGLMARVTLARGPDGKLEIRAVEAIPLTNMHAGVAPLTGEAGQRRIAVLNHLGRDLDDGASGTEGLRFVPQADGTGLYCQPGAETTPGRIGALCRGWSRPEPTAVALERQIASACGEGALANRGSPPRGSLQPPLVQLPQSRPSNAGARLSFNSER